MPPASACDSVPADTRLLHKCHAVLLRWESSSLILCAIHHARLLLSQALLHLHAALHACNHACQCCSYRSPNRHTGAPFTPHMKQTNASNNTWHMGQVGWNQNIVESRLNHAALAAHTRLSGVQHAGCNTAAVSTMRSVRAAVVCDSLSCASHHKQRYPSRQHRLAQSLSHRLQGRESAQNSRRLLRSSVAARATAGTPAVTRRLGRLALQPALPRHQQSLYIDGLAGTPVRLVSAGAAPMRQPPSVSSASLESSGLTASIER